MQHCSGYITGSEEYSSCLLDSEFLRTTEYSAPSCRLLYCPLCNPPWSAVGHYLREATHSLVLARVIAENGHRCCHIYVDHVADGIDL